jgi:hypothetical protein
MRFILVCLSLGLALLGCENKDTKTATAKPTMTPQAGLARAPIQKAAIKFKKAPQAKGPTSKPASRAASQPTSRPTSRPTSAPASGGVSGQLSGTITLAPGLGAHVKTGQTLFIMVRRDAGEGKKGMMLAAKKVAVTGPQLFPLKYSMTGRDVMMQGTVLSGAIRVEARIDADGDAISKQPGDVTGKVGGVRKVGDKAVDFVLDKTIK